MRLVQYCQHALAGETGVANSARGWCEALARAGADVTLVVDEAQRRLPTPDGVRLRALAHTGRGPARVPHGLPGVLAGADLLVVHGGWHPGNAAVAALARRSGTPYVVLTHGVYYPAALARSAVRKRLAAMVWERRYLRGAVALHLLFPEEAEGLHTLGVDRPTVVAPNGIEPPPLRWDGGSGRYLLFLGRYDVTHKGLDLLLDGLARLPVGERPAVRLHGPRSDGHAEVTRMVAGRGLTDHVRVGGPIHGEEKWRTLAAARALVLTSRWEASPMALAEAAAAGVPALVTAVPMGRWLAERGAAVCVEATASGVADGLREVAAADLARIGERAREVALTELTWDAVARSWLDQVAVLHPSHAGG